MKILLVLFSWLVITENMFSADSIYSFNSLDIDKGLSHSNVTSILADSRGMLWIGTAFGLNCYNRHEMKNYFHKKEDPFSIPGNYVNFIAEDLQNTLWVSTYDGLVKYDKINDRFIVAVANEKIITYSFYCTDKDIWFGGKNKMYCYNYQDKKIKELSLKAKKQILSPIIRILEWKEGVLLLVTSSSGIWEYHSLSGTLQESVYQSLPSEIVTAYIDSERNLYLSGYRKGLFIFDRNGKLQHHFMTDNSQLTNNLIRDIVERKGNLWLATDGGGVNLMSLKPPYSISSLCHIPGNINSLPCNAINCLYKDQQESIWAGSVRNGASEIKEIFINTFKEVSPGDIHGLTNQAVNCLCKDEQGLVWIGTDGGGINRFDPKSQTFKHFPTTHNEKVLSIVEYSPSELLVSLYNNGVYLFNKATGKLVPFTIVDAQINYRECHSGYMEHIYKISNDRFFFLAYTPYIYDKQSRKFSTLKTKEDPALLLGLQMITATDEKAYLLNRYYLLSADLKTDSLSILFSTFGQEEMRTVDRDANGIFWIGTDRGLRRFDPQTKKQEIIQTNLFERVTAIIANRGQLWIGAQNTLFSYDINKQKITVWQESDGYLPNELMSICYTHISGITYIGGTHGLVQIRQSIASTRSEQPEVQLADVMLDGLSLPNQQEEEKQNGRHLSVAWNYKTLQVRIVSIEQKFFRKRLFKYMLHSSSIHGGETKTIETYNPTFSLDMLAPGEYFVYASCYTDDGVWSPPSLLLHLLVTPPWYKDYRILLPVGVFLLAILCWLVYLFILRKEEKMKWKMSEVLQKANQEKVQFLINISHELRTPLTLIYAPLKKIIEKVDGEVISREEWKGVKKQLTNIYRSANQMKNIINLTLDINRISDEENALHKRPHILNEWICSVAEEFKYELEAKRVDLVYRLDENIGTIEFDDYKCESVLSNMLMNALKFAPEGSRITLSSTFVNGGVRISVSDQGVGLGNLDPQKLFTRFYQGEQSQGGSGIGLSYAKTLIKKHGGVMDAFNNPDVGATFYFELPLFSGAVTTRSSMDNDVPLISFPLMEEEMAGAGDFSTKPYTVLVVEDNDELRRFLVESLKEDFRNVYQAVNGKEAWVSIVQRIPDIIISDIMMPLMDGYELCRKVKAEPTTCHVPVVLLTARGDKDSTFAGYKQGADAYLSKPFDLGFLQVILCNQLRSREMMKLKYRETYLRVAEDASVQVIGNSDEEFLLKFNKLVLDNLSSKGLDVKFLTEQINMSRSPLYNKLKALTNMGVNDYINHLRIEKASELLQHSPELTIAEISDEVGFEYQRYFSTIFKQTKGMTPTQFRLQVLANKDKKSTSGQ